MCGAGEAAWWLLGGRMMLARRARTLHSSMQPKRKPRMVTGIRPCCIGPVPFPDNPKPPSGENFDVIIRGLDAADAADAAVDAGHVELLSDRFLRAY